MIDNSTYNGKSLFCFDLTLHFRINRIIPKGKNLELPIDGDIMEKRRVLDSWKEIAAYLGRSVKTCRRWEHELSLPVHRLEDSPKARVFAYPEEIDQWIKKTQKSEEAHERSTPGIKRFFIPALVVVFAIFAVLIWKPFSLKNKALASSDMLSLAILYFENLSGEENLDYLQRVLPELLIRDLHQSKYLRVLRMDEIDDILIDLDLLYVKKYSLEDLRGIAEKGRVQKVIKGNFIKAGNALEITTWLIDTRTDETFDPISVQIMGGEEILKNIDGISLEIKQRLGLSPDWIAGDFDMEVGKITTSSLEAFKHFVEGSRYDATIGDQVKAIPLYKRSVAIDPQFATAYLALASANWKIGNFSEYKKYLRKSFKLKDHVSQRERYLIEAEYYTLSEKTFDLGIEAFTNLLEIYPDDNWAKQDLGFTYFELEDWDKSIELYSGSIKSIHSAIIAYHMMNLAYCAKGEYEVAIELLENYLDTNPDDPYIFQYLSSAYICWGKLDNALVEVKRALFLSPNEYVHIMTQGDIYLYNEELAKAEHEYLKLLEIEEIPLSIMFGKRRLASLYLMQGRFKLSNQVSKEGLEHAKKFDDKEWIRHWLYVLAYLDLQSGNPEQAVKKLTKVCTIADEEADLKYHRKALHLKATAYLESGSMNEAQRTADELNGMLENLMNKKKLRLSYHLLGMMELRGENLSEAKTHFEKALALMPFQYHPRYGDNHALFMDPLAFAYYKSENFEKSQKEYEKIISLTSGRLHYGDIYAKAFYMLGQIYEKKGWEGKAIDHYEKFLDLWKYADPGIAEVEDAKIRLIDLLAKTKQ
jgi:tetratricopeptide (TPR) repeat protein